MNKRESFYLLRHEYRLARREDAKWRPNPYIDRRMPKDMVGPDTAGAILRALSPRMVAAITARPGRAIMPLGPRASWYRNWSPPMGRYAGLSLSKRVALRSGLRQMKAMDEARRPLSFTTNMPLFEQILRWECGSLKLEAETARYKHKIAKSMLTDRA
jgi:hypothetical protein